MSNNSENNPKQSSSKTKEEICWKSDQLSSKDVLDLLEKEIHAEHNLIANRMTWYVASQSFLMAAFTITGNSTNYQYSWLATLIPFLGLLNSLIIWLSLQAAIQAMNNCKKFQEKFFNEDDHLKNCKELKKILLESSDSNNSGDYKQKWIHEVGLLPPRLIPLFFLTAWLFIFFKVLIFSYLSKQQNDIEDLILLIECIFSVFILVLNFRFIKKNPKIHEIIKKISCWFD